jgi:hypothetical protein
MFLRAIQDASSNPKDSAKVLSFFRQAKDSLTEAELSSFSIVS